MSDVLKWDAVERDDGRHNFVALSIWHDGGVRFEYVIEPTQNGFCWRVGGDPELMTPDSNIEFKTLEDAQLFCETLELESLEEP